MMLEILNNYAHIPDYTFARESENVVIRPKGELKKAFSSFQSQKRQAQLIKFAYLMCPMGKQKNGRVAGLHAPLKMIGA